MATEDNRKAFIESALWEMAHKSNPKVVEIMERVKRKYYI